MVFLVVLNKNDMNKKHREIAQSRRSNESYDLIECNLSKFKEEMEMFYSSLLNAALELEGG